MENEETEGLLFDVCATLADSWNINVWVLRIIFILTFGYGGGLVYAILALVI